MGFFDRASDRFAEQLLADPQSVKPGEGSADIVTFVRALPAAVQSLPDPALAPEIVPALAATARSAALEAGRAPTASMKTAPAAAPAAVGWRLRIAVLAAAVAFVPVLMATLASAGIELPEPVDDVFYAVGVDLPNQDADSGVPAGALDDPAKGDDKASGQETGAQRDDEGTAQSTGGGSGSGGDGNETGAGNGEGGKPAHAGPDATPPGHGGTPPGQGGVPPGNAGVPPGGGSGGSTGPPPDAGPPATPPGQGGTPPGQGGIPPGQAKP